MAQVRIAVLFFLMTTACTFSTTFADKQISYISITGKQKNARFVFRSPTVNRLPQKTVDAFNKILVVLRAWPQFHQLFIAHHKSFWVEGASAAYKKSLIVPKKPQPGSYYYEMTALPLPLKKTILGLHASILRYSTFFAQFKARAKEYMTLRNALIATGVVTASGMGLYFFLQHRKKKKAYDAILKIKAIREARRDRREQRKHDHLFRHALIDPAIPRNEEHALFRSDEAFDESARKLTQQIATLNFRMDNKSEIPDSWKPLDSDNRVFQDTETGLIIKLPRMNFDYRANHPTFNIDRVAGAFRVNHVAPEVWKHLVAGTPKHMKKKEREHFAKLSKDFKVKAVHSRLIPLAGTVTPGQATADIPASPFDDINYIVVEQPLALKEAKLMHEGGAHAKYTPEQVHQLAQAGRYGGASDMHNRNIDMTTDADGNWRAQLFDLEPLVAYKERVYKQPSGGYLPSRREVTRNIYHEASHGHDPYMAKYLGVDEQEEIDACVTDAVWHMKRGIRGWSYKSLLKAFPEIEQRIVAHLKEVEDNPPTFLPGANKETWEETEDGEKVKYLLRRRVMTRDELVDAYGEKYKLTPEKIAVLKKFWEEVEPGGNYEQRFTHPDIVAAFGS